MAWEEGGIGPGLEAEIGPELLQLEMAGGPGWSWGRARDSSAVGLTQGPEPKCPVMAPVLLHGVLCSVGPLGCSGRPRAVGVLSRCLGGLPLSQRDAWLTLRMGA